MKCILKGLLGVFFLVVFGVSCENEDYVSTFTEYKDLKVLPNDTTKARELVVTPVVAKYGKNISTELTSNYHWSVEPACKITYSYNKERKENDKLKVIIHINEPDTYVVKLKVEHRVLGSKIVTAPQKVEEKGLKITYKSSTLIYEALLEKEIIILP